MKSKSILSLFFLVMLIQCVSSLPIYVKPLDAGNNVIPNSVFYYQFNFTTDSLCTNVVLSNFSKITTLPDGTSVIDLNISSMTSIPRYSCEYRGTSPTSMTLREVHTLSDALLKNIYAQSANFTENVSADWFHGKLNHSDVMNQPSYLGLSDQRYNETQIIKDNNASWLSTFNGSYIPYLGATTDVNLGLKALTLAGLLSATGGVNAGMADIQTAGVIHAATMGTIADTFLGLTFTLAADIKDSTAKTTINNALRILTANDGIDAILNWATKGLADFGDSNITTLGFLTINKNKICNGTTTGAGACFTLQELNASGSTYNATYDGLIGNSSYLNNFTNLAWANQTNNFLDSQTINGTLSINQTADSRGLQINGFDDRASSNIQVFTDSSGYQYIKSTSYIVFQPSGVNLAFMSSTYWSMYDDKLFRLGGGSAGQSGFAHRSTANYSLVIQVANNTQKYQSRAIIVCDEEDVTYAFRFPTPTDPTLYLSSAYPKLNQTLWLSHNASSGLIGSTGGRITILNNTDITGNLSVSGLAGTGNAYACLDASGKLYRSSLACV